MRIFLIYDPLMHTQPAHAQAGQALPVDPSRLPLLPVATGHEPRRWTSRTLLDGEREILIDHEGSTYRLRLTSLGKLILTK